MSRQMIQTMNRFEQLESVSSSYIYENHTVSLFKDVQAAAKSSVTIRPSLMDEPKHKNHRKLLIVYKHSLS